MTIHGNVPTQNCMFFFAGLCCCTFVGFNQGLIFEAMPILYMASRKAPKTNNLPSDLGKVSMSKPTHPVLGNYDVCPNFFTRNDYYSYRRYFFSKKVLGTEMSSIKNQSFATILHRDQSNHLLTNEHRSQMPYSATSRNWNIPLWLWSSDMCIPIL